MRRHLSCSASALLALIAVHVPAVAQPRVSEFQAHVWYTAIPQAGEITCPGGGEPSASLMPPWCVDSRTKVRNRVLTGLVDTASDPRVQGTIKTVMNLNLDDSFEGPAWGTYEIEVPGRGTWEGTWQGRHRGLRLATYHLVAHGSGEFEGLQLRADLVWQAGKGESITGEIFGLRKD